MSGRVMHTVQRFTLNQGNDNPMMQELHLDGMNSESRNAVERVQSFGFTSTPLPRDQGGDQQGGQSSGTGGDGAQDKGPAAEGICLYVGGQRNHPVCIGIDDRRHRPMGLKAGENAQYDDIGQMTLLRRDATHMLSLDSKDENGKDVQRYVSVRHVEKEKQKRPGGQQSGGQSGQAGAQARDAGGGQQQQDFKHEGQTVNNEVRVNKGRIEFRTGDTVVAYYDKQSDSWVFHVGGKVTITGATIVLDGMCLIGGADASAAVGMLGSIDTAGDKLVAALASRANTK
jgi:phage gp45-like